LVFDEVTDKNKLVHFYGPLCKSMTRAQQ